VGPLGTLGKLRSSVRAFTRELTRVSTPVFEVPAPKRPKLGIALGGGFARGLAHIGILKVLEEEQIPVDFVAGTSVGAVIGAAYCSGLSAAELEEMAGTVRFSDFARWTLSRYGFASNIRMAGFLKRVVQARTFEDLKVPLAVTATDFQTGDGVVFSSGPLIDPIRASCAYPGMFLPVQINGRLLIDGMLAHTLPTAPLREMGADRVLGVYLKSHWCAPTGPKHIFEVIGQCFSIAQSRISATCRSAADLTIEPEVCGIPYDGFDRAPQLIAAGEAVARAALPEIRAWFGLPSPSTAPAVVAAPQIGAGPAPEASIAGD